MRRTLVLQQFYFNISESFHVEPIIIDVYKYYKPSEIWIEMIDCNLLSRNERRFLQDAISKNINAVEIYTLEYKEGLKICAFIKMVFEKGSPLIITTGKFADNILLLDEFDFLKEKKRYDLQGDVEVKVSSLSNFEAFDNINGKLLADVKCIKKPNEEYYWQFNFILEKKLFIINALIDELEFSIV